MVNDLVKQYLNHSHRTWITWATAGALGLLLVIPAWDGSSEARSERVKLDSDLAEMTQAAASLSQMQVRLTQAASRPDVATQMIDSDQADVIRDDVTRLVHKLNCQMRRLTLSAPTTRLWAEDGDNPFAASAPTNTAESISELETRHVNVSVEGNLSQLSRLTIALTRLNRFAVPTAMTLQRERVNGQLRLDVDLSLFNLVENND